MLADDPLAARARRLTVERPGPRADVVAEDDYRPRFRVVDAAGLDALPTPTWILDGLLPASGVSVLYGPPGCGKSFVALDWALRIATGQPWLGHATRWGPTVFVAAEGGAGLRTRRDAWCESHGIAVADLTAAYFVLAPLNLMQSDLVSAFLADLEHAIPAAPALIVLDTLALSMEGGDENNTADMNVAVAALRRLAAETRAGVLVVHHMSKDGRWERGSIALRGGADTMGKLEAEDGMLTLTNDKQRDAVLLDPMRLRLRSCGRSCVVEPAEGASWVSHHELGRNDRRLLDAFAGVALGGATTLSVWRDATDLHKGSFYRSRKHLIEGGYVTQAGSTYKLTERGQEAQSHGRT